MNKDKKNTNKKINDDNEIKIIVNREHSGLYNFMTLYESIVEKNIDDRLNKIPESSQFTAIRNCI